jgi:hypothetical protein
VVTVEARFEDHGGFQRTVLLCAAGASLAAVFSLPAGAVAAMVALSAWPGAEVKRRRLLAGVGAAVFGAWYFTDEAWLMPVMGGLLGLSFCTSRRELEPPKPWAVAATVSVSAASTLLLPLASAAVHILPRFIAGAAYGLWLGIASAPLHVVLGGDPVEMRLSALRLSLTADLRALAERAVTARRSALALLPRGELRGVFDSLALGALQVAAQAAELSRSASPALENDLQRRAVGLAQSAAKTDDEAAQKSYQRAAEALQGQLDHLLRVRLARDRAVARLHEEVENLERARFSLTLAQVPGALAELELLQAPPLDILGPSR